MAADTDQIKAGNAETPEFLTFAAAQYQKPPDLLIIESNKQHAEMT